MYSLAYLVIAVVDFAVLVWAARLCLRYRTNGLIFASIPLTLLWYDNFVIGVGGTLGEGELLKGLNTVRFLAHYIGLPMTFIALGAMAREAGFGWARTRLAIGAGRSIPPIPAITLTNMMILFGIYLWYRIGWKWLTLGSIGAMAFFAVPSGPTGGIFGNVGEPIISIVIISTAAHIARLHQQGAPK